MDMFMETRRLDTDTEKFIHIYHVDLDRMISDNEAERCRLVSKLQQYNTMVNKPWFAFPMQATDVMDMPALGSARVHKFTPANRSDKDWVYMSDWELEEIERYGDELDELHEFIDHQFAGVICKPLNYHEMLLQVHHDTPSTVDSPSDVSVDQREEPIGPVCEQADADILGVAQETGRLYTIRQPSTESAESTSSSEPVEVNHTKEAPGGVTSTSTAIISNVREIQRATPKVRMKQKKETHLAVHTTSHVPQPVERLVRCIANLASSVYDGGGRPGEVALPAESEDRTELRNIMNDVGTIVRAVIVQHTVNSFQETVNSFRTQRGWGGPAVVEVY